MFSIATLPYFTSYLTTAWLICLQFPFSVLCAPFHHCVPAPDLDPQGEKRALRSRQTFLLGLAPPGRSSCRFFLSTPDLYDLPTRYSTGIQINDVHLDHRVSGRRSTFMASAITIRNRLLVLCFIHLATKSTWLQCIRFTALSIHWIQELQKRIIIPWDSPDCHIAATCAGCASYHNELGSTERCSQGRDGECSKV